MLRYMDDKVHKECAQKRNFLEFTLTIEKYMFFHTFRLINLPDIELENPKI